MIDNLAIAVGTAIVTVIGTRWVDTRRQLAGERSVLAAELRVQLAEAHRRGEACVRAMETAMSVAERDENGVPTDEFRKAAAEFGKKLEDLRSQASELLVRSSLKVRSSVSDPVTSILQSGDRLLNWMQYDEIPAKWDGDEETFLLAQTNNLACQPDLLIMVGAPQATPAAVDPQLAAVLRRVARQERREVHRQRVRWLAGELTGKNRREARALRARQDAARARIDPLVSENADRPAGMKHEEMTFDNACIFTARVETNVPQGGDAGHGGKTTLTLTDDGSFAFGWPHSAVSDGTVAIEVLGDVEARVLAEALAWAGERLRAIIATEAADSASETR